MSKYNTAEIEAALNSLVVLVDTREKVWGHIKSGLERRGCPYDNSKKLDFGDYSYKFTDPEGNEIYCQDKIVVERKANAEEISGNFTRGRATFEKEFLRAKKVGATVFLLIENCNWGMIDNHDYRTNYNVNSFESSLWSWMIKYDLKLQFCNSSFSAKLIHGLFRYHLRNKLEKMGVDTDAGT